MGWRVTALKNNSKTALNREDGAVGTRQFSIVNDRTMVGTIKSFPNMFSNVSFFIFHLKERGKYLRIKRYKKRKKEPLTRLL